MKTLPEWKKEVEENGLSLNQIAMILRDWEEQNNKLVRGFTVDKISMIKSQCCVMTNSSLGGFCAGGEKAGLKYKVKKYLEEIEHEYNADNVILALFELRYIDYNKIWG